MHCGILINMPFPECSLIYLSESSYNLMVTSFKPVPKQMCVIVYVIKHSVYVVMIELEFPV